MLQDINKGSAPNDKTGTPARQAADIINANFAYLDNKITRKDSIVESTGFVESGQDKTMNPFWKWIIDTIDYTNPASVTINFPYAASGKMRLDMIALTTSNAPVRIPGPESTSSPVSPTLPANMLEAGLVLVTDSEVGDITPPVIGDKYYTKVESDAADATTLASANSYTDSKVSSVYKWKGSVANYTALPSSGNTVGDVWDIADTGMNYGWTGTGWDALGTTVNISGKEDTSNKTDDIETNKTSSVKYGSAKGIWDLIVAKCVQISNIKTVNGNSLVGTGNIVTPDMDTTTAQNVSGLKTFLNGMFGLRNVANTFTSFFTNTNTASRTYTLPDKNGTVAMTSDIVAQLNGVVNYLVKFGTTTTGVVSRILDTGTYIGIGTIRTPSKDITFGNQSNREIGIENSNSLNTGRDLTIKAGNTVNFIEDLNLLPYGEGSQQYMMMHADKYGGVFYSTYASNFRKRTNDSGNFIAVPGSPQRIVSMCVKSNGDVYVAGSDFVNDIYVQIGGSGAFTRLNANRKFTAMCVISNGDVYAAVGSGPISGGAAGDIYKQTGGSGAFIALGMANQNWSSMAAGISDDIYICVYGGDIYKKPTGSSVFTALGGVSRNWSGITVASNGDVYACVSNGDIYKQTGGSGAFIATGQATRTYTGVAISTNGYLYACADSNDIYTINTNALGTADLSGGILKLKAGVGKGTGQSRTQIITGQKTTSGTDMQIEQVVIECDENGKTTFNGVIKLKGYTVSTLPTGVIGDTAYVTDATSPTFLATVVGGGSVKCRVFYDGVNWIVN